MRREAWRLGRTGVGGGEVEGCGAVVLPQAHWESEKQREWW